MINKYRGIAPQGDLVALQKLGDLLNSRSFLHINSTKEGGGVAEILHRMVPILKALGIKARWEVIKGNAKFYDITKKIHNALQGNAENPTSEMWEYYEEVNRKNAAVLDLEADAVLDP